MDDRPNDVSIHLDTSSRNASVPTPTASSSASAKRSRRSSTSALEFAERQRSGLREDLEDLQREIADVKQMLDVLGPSSLGVLRILAGPAGGARGRLAGLATGLRED